MVHLVAVLWRLIKTDETYKFFLGCYIRESPRRSACSSPSDLFFIPPPVFPFPPRIPLTRGENRHISTEPSEMKRINAPQSVPGKLLARLTSVSITRIYMNNTRNNQVRKVNDGRFLTGKAAPENEDATNRFTSIFAIRFWMETNYHSRKANKFKGNS